LVYFLDLGAAFRELEQELHAAIARVTLSGRYIGGPEVASFEEEFAAYCGALACVGVGNGLDALHLALRAMDIGQGDEVIVSSNGYIATWLAVSLTGAIPVPVEPDPRTHNLDPARVEAAITRRTKVILPTHLYGQPADLDPMIDLARSYDLRILEDAAQAHGAHYKGRRVGLHGDAVAWSFYPSKNLGALGDAGAVTSNDPELIARVRTLANYGSSERYVNAVRRVNSRLDPVQAAILRVKLRCLDEWNERRAAIAARYLDRLKGLPGIQLPHVPNWAMPVWHLFVINAAARDGLAAELRVAGVETLIHYPIPPHLQDAYADLQLPRGSFPVAERLAREVLSLPIGPHLSAEDAERVIDGVLAATQAQS